MGTTFVPSGVRRTIAADPTVGGGNALEAAVRVSPDIHAPYLFSEEIGRASCRERVL